MADALRDERQDQTDDRKAEPEDDVRAAQLPGGQRVDNDEGHEGGAEARQDAAQDQVAGAPGDHPAVEPDRRERGQQVEDRGHQAERAGDVAEGAVDAREERRAPQEDDVQQAQQDGGVPRRQVALVHVVEELGKHAVAAHGKGDASRAHDGGLQAGQRAAEHRHDHDVLPEAAADLVADEGQDVGAVGPHRADRRDALEGEDHERVDEEEDDDRQDGGRAGLLAFGLFADVGGGVPARVQEDGDQDARDQPRLGEREQRAHGVHRPRQASAVDHHDGDDAEADQQRVLEHRPDPVEARRELDAEGGHDEHEDVEDGANERHPVLVVGRAVREEAQEVGAERHGEAGRADRVVHEHDPAGEEAGVRVERPADPRVGGAGARLPGVEALVADGNADHRDEADEDRHERVVVHRGHEADDADGDALGRSRTRQSHDHDVAPAQGVGLETVVAGTSRRRRGRPVDRHIRHGDSSFLVMGAVPGRSGRRDAPVAQVAAAEHVAGGLAGDREDDFGSRVDVLETVEGTVARVEAHAAQPDHLVAAGEVEQAALLGAGHDDLEELLLVSVVETKTPGQQPVERVGDLGGAGVEPRRERDGDHGLFGDHRPAVDDPQAPHPPDVVALLELQGVCQGLGRHAAHDVEDAGRDLVGTVLFGEGAQQAAGASRLAHDPRAGDESAEPLVAVHAAFLLELGERAAHRDQAHAGHLGELAAARQAVARSEVLLDDQAFDQGHDVAVPQAPRSLPGRHRRCPRPTRRSSRPPGW